jgi:hypothetical protein
MAASLLSSLVLAAPDPIDPAAPAEGAPGPDLQQAIATAYDWHQGGGGLYAFASNGGQVADESVRQTALQEVEQSLAWVRSQGNEIDSGALPEFKAEQAAAQQQGIPASTYITQQLDNLKAVLNQGQPDAGEAMLPPADANPEPAPLPPPAPAPVTGSAKEAHIVISVAVFNQARQVAQKMMQQMNGTNSTLEGKVQKILFELDEIETQAGGNLSEALDDEVDPSVANWAARLIKTLSTLQQQQGAAPVAPAAPAGPTPTPEQQAQEAPVTTTAALQVQAFLQKEQLGTEGTRVKTATDGSVHVTALKPGPVTLVKLIKFASTAKIAVRLVKAFEEEDEAASCPQCAGPGVPLGQLGNLMHYRCRDCGAGFSHQDESAPAFGKEAAIIPDTQHPERTRPEELPYGEDGSVPAFANPTVFDAVHTAASTPGAEGVEPEDHVIKVGDQYLVVGDDTSDLANGGTKLSLTPSQKGGTRLSHSLAQLWMADDRLGQFLATQDSGTEARIVRVVPKKTAQVKTAQPDVYSGYCPVCGSPDCQGECSENKDHQEETSQAQEWKTSSAKQASSVLLLMFLTMAKNWPTLSEPDKQLAARITGKTVAELDAICQETLKSQSTLPEGKQGSAKIALPLPPPTANGNHAGPANPVNPTGAPAPGTPAPAAPVQNIAPSTQGSSITHINPGGANQAPPALAQPTMIPPKLDATGQPIQASEGTLNGSLSEAEGTIIQLQELADSALAKARLLNDEDLVDAVERMNTSIFEAGMAARHAKGLAAGTKGHDEREEKEPKGKDDEAEQKPGELKEASAAPSAKTACDGNCKGDCPNCKNKKTAGCTSEDCIPNGDGTATCRTCGESAPMRGIIHHKKTAAERNDFKVTFEDGNSLTTGFNGTLAEAKAYYVGKEFNHGDVDGKDKMVKGVSVEQIGKQASAKRSDDAQVSAMAREVVLGWMSSHPKQAPDWMNGDWKQLWEQNRADCQDENVFITSCQRAYAEMSKSLNKGSRTVAALALKARGLMGPSAEKGDTVANAVKFMHGNAKAIEDETVAGLRQLLADAGYHRTVVELAIEEVFGEGATLANGALLKTLLKD